MCLRRVVFSAAILWAATLSAPATASAQAERASIAGLVQDSSGAVLPGVTVEASSPVLIGGAQSTVTDGAGRYTIIDLRPGTYVVTFSLTGFKTVRREGLLLEGAFAARVNASLEVGALEETVTVSGVSPVVDTQSTRAQFVVNQAMQEALPAARLVNGAASLVPGLIVYNTSPGQILSSGYISYMSVHGSSDSDQHTYGDGMMVATQMIGTGKQLIAGGLNDLGQAEWTVDVGSHSAEMAAGGPRMDTIPKEGGNTFSGTWRVFGSNGALQNDNLTPALKAGGLAAANKLDYNWDSNVAVGGPILQNKLWYFTAFQLSQFNILVANSFFPDGRQADTGGGVGRNGTARLTYQLTPRNKVAVAYNNSNRYVQRNDFNSLTSPEAALNVTNPVLYSALAKWTTTATNRLLIEVGQSTAVAGYNYRYQPEVGPLDIEHREASTGRTTVATSTAFNGALNQSHNTVANLSYVTGSHTVKTGVNFASGYARNRYEHNGDVLRLTFLNGRPNSVSVRNTPVTARTELNGSLGLFAQDKWTLTRLTLNYGGRYDYLNGNVPAQSAPAGRFVPAREAAAIPCVPCWRKDWAVRLGGAYDLFGTGKTALKASLGKFLASELMSVASAVNPMGAETDTRAWIDLDGNGSVLDADGGAQYNEIGPSRNSNFGVPRGATRWDTEAPRGSNWEQTVSIQQEVLPGVSVTAGYYRRQFHDLTVTRNLLVDPDLDYAPFTITAPTDPRLPNGGGEVITMYNLNPTKLGAVDSLRTYSRQNTRKYDGFEFSFNARLPRNGFAFGGVTTERTATNGCDVANPNSRRFCIQVPPFRTLYKGSAAYTLPFNVQLSGSVELRPGASVNANYTFNSATAGVPLTGGGSLSVNLVDPATSYLDYVKTTDLRAGRTFRLGRRRVQAFVEIFNAANTSTVVSMNQTFGPRWLEPLIIVQARRFQLGAQIDF